MKGIVVDEKNYLRVAGKLKKFFMHGDISMWHQFDCGMKKRIGHMIEVDGEKFDVKRNYPSVTTHLAKDGFFIVFMNENEGFVLQYDDEVWFLGNRIIIKTEWCADDKNYIYECFQINK